MLTAWCVSFHIFLYTNRNVYKHMQANVILCFVVLFCISMDSYYGHYLATYLVNSIQWTTFQTSAQSSSQYYLMHNVSYHEFIKIYLTIPQDETSDQFHFFDTKFSHTFREKKNSLVTREKDSQRKIARERQLKLDLFTQSKDLYVIYIISYHHITFPKVTEIHTPTSNV